MVKDVGQIMVDDTPPSRAGWRVLRPVVQVVVLAMWMVAGLIVAVCVCVAVMFWDAVPFDEPGRAHVGEHVYSLITWIGVGGGFVSGVLLAPRASSASVRRAVRNQDPQ